MFVIQEYIPLGQRVGAYTIQTYNGTQWTTAVSSGTTIGYKRINNLASPIAATKARLIITKSRPVPLINTFALIGKHFVTTPVLPAGFAPVRPGITVSLTPHGHLALLAVPEASTINAELLDLNGRVTKLRRSGGPGAEFLVPHHAPGIYFVRVSIDGKMAAQRSLYLP